MADVLIATSVLIVDNSEVILKGIKNMLSIYEDIHVVGAVCSLKEATQAVAQLKPDVTVLDLSLTEGEDQSLEDAQALIRSSRAVICISVRNAQDIANLTAALGMTKCVDKMNLFQDLPEAIRGARTL